MLFSQHTNHGHMLESTAFKWYFCGILLFGIALRVLCLIFNSDISRDGIVYLQQAEILAQSGWENFFKIENIIKLRPPLYLSLIAYGINLGLSAKTTGLAIAMFCGIILPAILQKITWELSRNAEFSLWNMLLAACFPYFCRMSADVLRDGIYLMLLAFFLLYLFRCYSQPTWLNSLYCGIWSMLGILNRFEAMETILFFLLVPMILILQKQRKCFATGFKIILFFMLGMLICLLIFNLVFHYPYTMLLEMYARKLMLYIEYIRV